MKRVLIVVLILVGLFGGIVFIAKKSEKPVAIKSYVTVYKTATCGCCANYIGYLRSNGYDVKIVNYDSNDQMNAGKLKMDIPVSLNSCHTTVFDKEKYFAEGHIPVEALNKLLAEKPQIKGIGMPGMPSASPGMPGTKIGPFNISQVSTDGKTSSYMLI